MCVKMKSVIIVLFSVVINCAIHCDDSSQNYFVVEAPPEPRVQKPFTVYWNVPTMQCRSKKLPFDNLDTKFGIVQNANDSFRGEKIAILYDPGCFPAILTKDDSKEVYFRNGGVPQEGDLKKHLRTFRSDVEKLIPDANFSGIAVIDFESWRPIFRQNFGVINPYKNLSIEIEKQRHPWWYTSKVKAEARRRFETSAKEFMLQSLLAARQQRPLAAWGYYGFPYCFNVPPGGQFGRCSKEAGEENNRIDWLWKASDGVYPSIYSLQTYDTEQLASLVRTRVEEAARAGTRQLLPYFWYRYRDGSFLSEKDVKAVLNTLYRSNATGVIIWGSSQDVRTVDQCQKLYEYLNNTLGPIVAKYTKSKPKLHNENGTDFYTTTEATTTKYPSDNVELPSSINETFSYDLDDQDDIIYNDTEYSDIAGNESLTLFDIIYENITNVEFNNVSHVSPNSLVVVKNDEDADENEFAIIDEQVERFLKVIELKLQHPLGFYPNKTVHDINENRTHITNLWRNAAFQNSMKVIVNKTNMRLNESHPHSLLYKIHKKISSAINIMSNQLDLSTEREKYTIKTENFDKLNVLSTESKSKVKEVTENASTEHNDVTDNPGVSPKATIATYPYFSTGYETHNVKKKSVNSTDGMKNESKISITTGNYTQSSQHIMNSLNSEDMTLPNAFEISTVEYSRNQLSMEGPSTEMNIIESYFNITDFTELLPDTNVSDETTLKHIFQTTEDYNIITEINVDVTEAEHEVNPTTLDTDYLTTSDELSELIRYKDIKRRVIDLKNKTVNIRQTFENEINLVPTTDNYLSDTVLNTTDLYDIDVTTTENPNYGDTEKYFDYFGHEFSFLENNSIYTTTDLDNNTESVPTTEAFVTDEIKYLTLKETERPLIKNKSFKTEVLNTSADVTKDNVSSASSTKKSKHIICFIFYFYSTSKCICDLYDDC